MPFTILPYRRFPVHCAVTNHASLFLKLPLAYFSGFWLLITLLLLSSGPAYAEWVALGDSDSETTVYVDPDTIRRKGDLVKMWELYDFKIIRTVAGDSYFSSKAQIENDCAEERRRTLAFTWFSENMGSGKVVFSESYEGRWAPVVPDTIGLMLWTFACRK
jgi:hypothetical protein